MFSDSMMLGGGRQAAFSIANSVRLDGAADYFTLTPSVEGNRKTWTFSTWVKRSKLTDGGVVFSSSLSGPDAHWIYYKASNDALYWQDYPGSTRLDLLSTGVFRDTSAWMHVLAVLDTTQGQASERARLYVNGNRITDFVTQVYPDQHAPLLINTIGRGHHLGACLYNGEIKSHMGGYLSQPIFIDGIALDPSYFGETDPVTGSWRPKRPNVPDYGPNGFHLDFADVANLGKDAANTSIVAMFDSSQANTNAGLAFSNNNRTVSYVNAPSDGYFPVNMQMQADAKVHVEINVSALDSAGAGFGLCLRNAGESPGYETTYFGFLQGFGWGISGAKNGETAAQLSASASATDRLTCEIDVAGQEVKVWQNGTLIADWTSVAMPGDPVLWGYTSNGTGTSRSGTATYNFGQSAFNDPVTSGFSGLLGGNDWTPVSLGAADVVADSPTNNYATWNPLKAGHVTLSQGALRADYAATGDNSLSMASFAVTEGKYYAELTVTSANIMVGVAGTDIKTTGNTSPEAPSQQSPTVWYRGETGEKYVNAVINSYGDAFGSGDVIGIALDLDTRIVQFSRNGVLMDPIDLPATSQAWSVAATQTGLAVWECIANFGQYPFTYTSPAGFKSLCTANLPAPAIQSPAKHFDVLTYTGTGAAQSITGLDFQPDLVWIKNRGASTDHRIYDSIRGAAKQLYPNSTSQENTSSAGLSSFNADGFSLFAPSTDIAENANGNSYVAWCWKAGGPAVANTAGSIPSQVSVNRAAGFSIVTYTGNGLAGATIGHGLGTAPAFIITKTRGAAINWLAYHIKLGAAQYMVLNGLAPATTNLAAWNNTAPSSSVVTLGDGTGVNSPTTMVAYCWTEVPGFSSFGSYTGNGSTDGPFVHCGFRPRWVMVKCGSGEGNWDIHDTARSAYNPSIQGLHADSANSETNSSASTVQLDITSNGFKIRGSNASNGNGSTYIYAAFAEAPFGGKKTTPAKAR